MQLKLWIKSIALGLSLISSMVFAVPEQVQMTTCLAKKLNFEHKILAENREFKIVELDTQDINGLRLLADQSQCGAFVNLSPEFETVSEKNKLQHAKTFINSKLSYIPTKKISADLYEIKHANEVNAALDKIVQDNIWDTVSHMTSYKNRSATKNTGLATAKWLKTSFEALAAQYGRKDTKTFFVQTGRYLQPSLVTVIGKDIVNQPALVIGAHMDTLDGNMPGAGDDASGSASIMEAARVLLSSNLSLKRPVYIIWYAAEERGLVGSQYVVRHFINNRIPVKAVVQFDMTGYRNNAADPTMWIYTDFTDTQLNNFLAQLINNYIHVPVNYSTCGYGCSDHASWTERGFPAAFPCETSFTDHNPYIHSPSDTMNLLNLEHMKNFSKLALAFIVELGLEN